MFSWTRNFYAVKDGEYYQFESKKSRDNAVECFGYCAINAREAYKNYPHKQITEREWRRFRAEHLFSE